MYFGLNQAKNHTCCHLHFAVSGTTLRRNTSWRCAKWEVLSLTKVIQYVLIRTSTTIISVSLEFFDVYCPGSVVLETDHLYVALLNGISVGLAMFSLLALYMPIRADIARYKPGTNPLHSAAVPVCKSVYSAASMAGSYCPSIRFSKYDWPQRPVRPGSIHVLFAVVLGLYRNDICSCIASMGVRLLDFRA
jgi:Organic solute transporter Ostalpha